MGNDKKNAKPGNTAPKSKPKPSGRPKSKPKAKSTPAGKAKNKARTGDRPSPTPGDRGAKRKVQTVPHRPVQRPERAEVGKQLRDSRPPRRAGGVGAALRAPRPDRHPRASRPTAGVAELIPIRHGRMVVLAVRASSGARPR